jgi:hypothetical protein
MSIKIIEALELIRRELVILGLPEHLRKDQRLVFELERRCHHLEMQIEEIERDRDQIGDNLSEEEYDKDPRIIHFGKRYDFIDKELDRSFKLLNRYQENGCVVSEEYKI